MAESDTRVVRVLFVCLGNICRSPLAEGVFLFNSKKHSDWLFDGNGVEYSVEAESCGTAGYHSGESPDSRSQEVARKHGFDISRQRARQITHEDFDCFDYIVTMDDSNYQSVKHLMKSAKKTKASLHKFVEFMEPNDVSQFGEIPDPYYGGKREFEQVYQLLDKGMPSLFNLIKSKL